MTTVNVLYEYWRERLGRDLSPFTDPGTELHLEGEGRSLRAQWICRGTERQAQFSISADEGVQVSFLGNSLSYRSFLMGPEMADLLGLAKMILQAQKPLLFIPTKASLVDEPERPPEPALDLLTSVLTENSSDATKIVMVTGEAGAGKTRVLQELVRRQAHAFQHGQVGTLYFYVNAQGRALARLAEALATELQDLRAILTYHAVATLVRLGALIPVIDGFDELLGASGYDDAFSSLAGFIEELDGEGQIVASARSTYYEEEFVARATTASSLGGQVWVQVPIQVRAWGSEEFTSYVRGRVAEKAGFAGTTEEVVANLEQVFSGINTELRQKPLFVARAVDLVLSGRPLTGSDDLLNELVVAYLERERSEKLLDRNERPLLSKEQIAVLLASLAEEMWNQETRELDRRSVREVAEYVLVVEDIDEATQQIVLERMPNLAFLAPGDRTGSITFEHELFFSVFLARVIAEAILRKESSVRMILSRSVFPPELAGVVVREMAAKAPLEQQENLRLLLDKLADAGAPEGVRSGQIRENGGRLAAAALLFACRAGKLVEGIRIKGVVFPGGELKGVRLRNTKFESVAFRRTDLTETSIIESAGRDVVLQEVTLDPKRTRLEIRGIDPASQIFGLRVWNPEGIKNVYDPEEIRNVLVACGTVPAEAPPAPKRKVPVPRIRLLEKLVRAYGRANPVCTSDDNLRALFGDSSWPAIERLLVQHGVVLPETRNTGGRPKVFLRRQVLPEEIMSGARRDAKVPPQVRQFWDAMEKLK